MLNTTVPVTIPARMLNEYTYCPRLAYLEWVQGEWADSADTIDGEFVHRNADREDRRALPTPAESSEPISIHTRSLHLENQTLGLVAVVDILEVEGNIVTLLTTNAEQHRKRPKEHGNPTESKSAHKHYCSKLPGIHAIVQSSTMQLRDNE